MRKRFFHQALLLLLCACLVLGSGIPAQSATLYGNASGWAEPEIVLANQKGLLTTRLIGQDLTLVATREEVCELAVQLYENLTGTQVAPVDPNPFVDTNNPSILKAFALGITNGVQPNLFGPSQTIYREQVATLYGRMLEKAYPNAQIGRAHV